VTQQDTEVVQVLIGQVVQNVGIDRVVAECRLILLEAKAPQPNPDIHDRVLSLPRRASSSR